MIKGQHFLLNASRAYCVVNMMVSTAFLKVVFLAGAAGYACFTFLKVPKLTNQEVNSLSLLIYTLHFENRLLF